MICEKYGKNNNNKKEFQTGKRWDTACRKAQLRQRFPAVPQNQGNSITRFSVLRNKKWLNVRLPQVIWPIWGCLRNDISLQSWNPAKVLYAHGVTGAAILCGMLSIFPETIDKFSEERQKWYRERRSFVAYTQACKYIDVCMRVRESKMNSFGIISKHLQDVRQICILHIYSLGSPHSPHICVDDDPGAWW